MSQALQPTALHAAAPRPVFGFLLALDALAGALSRLFFEACDQDPVSPPMTIDGLRWQRERSKITMHYTEFIVALYQPDLTPAETVGDFQRRAAGALVRLGRPEVAVLQVMTDAGNVLADLAHYHPPSDYRKGSVTQDVIRLHERIAISRKQLLGQLELAGVDVSDAVVRRGRDVRPMGGLSALPAIETLLVWVAEARRESEATSRSAPTPPPLTADEVTPESLVREAAADQGAVTELSNPPQWKADFADVLGRMPPITLYAKLVHALLTPRGPRPQREVGELKREVWQKYWGRVTDETFRRLKATRIRSYRS